MALQRKSRSHIDVIPLCDDLGARQLRFTGFYGEPRRELRKNSWYLMRFLRAQLDLPWLCAGDFNEVLIVEEHFCMNEWEPWQMAGFQEVVLDCGFLDLGFSGILYTWDNRQEDDHNVKACLDRALGDHKFKETLEETSVKHVPTAFSDHAALIIKLRGMVKGTHQTRKRRAKPLRYEHMWQRHEGYVDFVNQAWDPGIGVGDLASVVASLSELQSSFHVWDRDTFGLVRKKLKSLREDLEEERNSTLYRRPTTRERSLMRELAETLAREEEMEQRSRSDWHKAGDRNTGFFQAKAKARVRTNRIRALKCTDGTVEMVQEHLEDMAVDFYWGLFMAQGNLQPELVCQHAPRKVMAQMCEVLERPFSTVEVETALFQMGPNKAPGADGFTTGFFGCWSRRR
ncbi:uncharacterized protein [Setaria viridis]|uniref:uncharacterized protein n=1 Tax=Setaria viridis TaxID=4556 RepID=UPI003B3AD7E9